MERKILAAFAGEGVTVKRAHPYHETLKHDFIWNQRMGMDVFKSIPLEAPLIVAVAVWQYGYHILAGLRDHRGPILTIANWSGQWPGLVGLLNLNGSLTKLEISGAVPPSQLVGGYTVAISDASLPCIFRRVAVRSTARVNPVKLSGVGFIFSTALCK